MKTIKTIMQETWKVNCDYGKENVYRVWDEDSNYHDDTSPETMDKRALLIAAAPDLLAALYRTNEILGRLADRDELSDKDLASVLVNREAIQKAEGKQ